MAKKAVAPKKAAPAPTTAQAAAVAPEGAEATATATEEVKEKELVVVSGVGADIWKESAFVPALRSDMSLAERKESCRELLRTAAKADDYLNLVSGEMLYEVNENAYWKDWTLKDELTGEERPYATFEEYADIELGLKRRKAYYLTKIYKRFVVELEVDREHLKDLQWSKAKIVEPLCTKENVLEILDKIKTMSKTAVEDYAKSLKAGEEGGDATTTTEAATEEFKIMKFKLAPTQYENVETALKIAGQLSGSDKEGNQLDMICSDFVAGNAGTGLQGALTNLNNSIQNLERAYGVKLNIESIVDEERYAKLQEGEEAAAAPAEGEATPAEAASA
jgi:hypothetical protein